MSTMLKQRATELDRAGLDAEVRGSKTCRFERLAPRGLDVARVATAYPRVGGEIFESNFFGRRTKRVLVARNDSI